MREGQVCVLMNTPNSSLLLCCLFCLFFFFSNGKAVIEKDKLNKPVELQWTAFRQVTKKIGNNLVFAFYAVYRSLVG